MEHENPQDILKTFEIRRAIRNNRQTNQKNENKNNSKIFKTINSIILLIVLTLLSSAIDISIPTRGQQSKPTETTSEWRRDHLLRLWQVLAGLVECRADDAALLRHVAGSLTDEEPSTAAPAAPAAAVLADAVPPGWRQLLLVRC